MTTDKIMAIYGKATRAFVDYEDYSREECVFYYLVLEKVINGFEPKCSNYLISGIEAIMETSPFIKTLFRMRFSANNKLSVASMAKELNLSKQGLLQRFEEGYNFIRCRDSQYDIEKRIALLNQSITYLQKMKDTHAAQYLHKNLPIETLHLRPHAYTCLKAYGIETVSVFMALKENEAKGIPGVGEKTLCDIMECQERLLAKFNNAVYQETEISLETLGLSARAKNCIRHIGVKTIDEFMKLTKREVLMAWHVGEKTWQEIYEKQQSLKYGDI